MDVNIVLAVIGVLATVVLGVWAIYQAFITKKKVQLTYTCEKCVSLLNEFSKGISDLQISYKGKPVGENLVLLRAYLINTGNKDITPAMVENKIKLCIPDEFQFIETKITEATSKFKCSITIIDPQSIEFATGLWKSKEYLKFDALISTPNIQLNTVAGTNKGLIEIRLNKEIRFEHRIADSTRVHKVAFPRNELISEKKNKSLLALFCRPFAITAFIYILLGIGVYILPNNSLEKELTFKVRIDDKEYFTKASARKDYISVQGENTPKKNLTPEEFIKAFMGEVAIVPASVFTDKILGILFVLIGSIFLAIYSYLVIRQNKILKFIKYSSNRMPV